MTFGELINLVEPDTVIQIIINFCAIGFQAEGYRERFPEDFSRKTVKAIKPVFDEKSRCKLRVYL